MTIIRYGITGVLCQFESRIDEETGKKVAALTAAVDQSGLPGILERVPAYCSLMIRFDPRRMRYETLCDFLKEAEKKLDAAGQAKEPKIVEIPVHYGGEDGPDLSFVAEHACLSEQEVVRIHSGKAYRIYMIGFLPGFPYLGGLDERLFTPRLSSPRTRIPAGSVGIGGQQTGIYPMDSPGGWQLIGRTKITLFDPSKPPLYQAGDLIRFVPV